MIAVTENLERLKKQSDFLIELSERGTRLPLLIIPHADYDTSWLVDYTIISLKQVLTEQFIPNSSQYVITCFSSPQNPYNLYLDEALTVRAPKANTFLSSLLYLVNDSGELFGLRDKMAMSGVNVTKEDFISRLENVFKST